MVDNSELILDDKKYLVVDTIEANNVKYVYFVDDDDDTDFFVRKEVTENEEKFLIGLDDDQEYDKAMNLFIEKHK
mgnify:FL=1